MNSLAIPQRHILLPRFEFPRWLRVLRDPKEERIVRQIAAGGIYGGLNAGAVGVASVVAPWYLAGGITAAQCAAAYQPKGASSLANSYINLNSPGTNDAAPGVAPTLSNGWLWNGSTQYLTTGLTTYTGTYSSIIRVTEVSNNGSLYGNGNSPYIFVYRDGSSGFQYANVDAGSSYVLPAASAGVFGLAGRKAYRNGVDEGIALGTAGSQTHAMLIGARNTSAGTPTEFSSNTTIAFVIYNITLTAAQMLAVSTAMAAL